MENKEEGQSIHEGTISYKLIVHEGGGLSVEYVPSTESYFVATRIFDHYIAKTLEQQKGNKLFKKLKTKFVAASYVSNKVASGLGAQVLSDLMKAEAKKEETPKKTKTKTKKDEKSKQSKK